MEIVGYSDPIDVRPGEAIRFMVSSTREKYRADVVRLIHGDENELGPGFIEQPVHSAADGDYDGRVQPIHTGSAVEVDDHPLLRPDSVTVATHVLPTTPGIGRQGILTKWSEADQAGYGLFLGETGRAEFVVRTRDGVVRVRTASPLVSHRWYLLTAGYDASTGRIAIVKVGRERGGVEAGTNDVAEDIREAAAIVHSPGPFLMAGRWSGAGSGLASIGEHFNGKISAPRVLATGPGTALELISTEGEATEGRDGPSVASWDLAVGIDSSMVSDASSNELHGRAVNMPTRGVTGHTWSGRSDHFVHAPGDYDAIHFHDDDLEDAQWESDVEWTVPVEQPSGIYALRLRATVDGTTVEDHVPFFIQPPPGGSAEVAFLAPTNTYYAYANERVEDSLGLDAHEDYQDETGRYRYIVENRLLSLYDHHSDGSGVCYSSRLRPNLTMRPRSRMRINNIPHLLGSDLHITEWLGHLGHEFDVITEEALHREGRSLLGPYRVVITGTHPEYWSEQMLDALADYLAAGGRCMYLGGNGFYWVTAFDPERPHVMEIRRPPGTTRAWEAWPGEYHLSSTGELGGLWRHRGRAPQVLTGVGFAAQGFDKSAPYYVNPDLEDNVAFVFEGVDVADGILGDQRSLVLGEGAAGFELDRINHELGTPSGTYLLASTRHTDFSDSYQAAVEDTMMSDSMQGGSVNENVRSDLALVTYPNGGAMFSVGSIAWSGALSVEDYQSDVSRVTRNVLEAFLDDEIAW